MSLDVELYVEVEVWENSFDLVCLYDANITHNLNEMAAAAGLYLCLWRPEEAGIRKAEELVTPLSLGLEKLKKSPGKYEAYNPKNGWGSYEDFVPWVESYLDACKKYPSALVRVSR